MILPDEFDWQFYGAQHKDLRAFNAEQLKAHYGQYGQHEGRCSSPAALRENFVKMIPSREPVLEIGPFHSPVVRGANARYFDVLDSEGLRRRARDIGSDPKNVPTLIHHVSPTGDLSAVSERFAAVVSSHCIEHQPDLIKHLRDVARLLREQGCYFLLIPDKRYCFDHFIAESTIAQIVEAHMEHRSTHTLRSVIEHRALTTHNDPARHWRGDHADPDYRTSIAARTQAAAAEFAAAQGRYIDVHAWQFTPDSFREIMTLLCELGYSSMRPLRVYGACHGRNEFTAVLQKSGGHEAHTAAA
jgi:SAM-dependent methyltransferase